jgi:hypothetical protein
VTIHVATVHWETDQWIDVQLRKLAEHLARDHLVYAFLNEVPGDWRHRFFYASTEDIEEHPMKLNLLGDIISLRARADDLLLFIDGDAFPVAPIDELAALLPSNPLIAVQRLENDGDRQPHPCFCLTTAGFWREIEGDWHRGHKWSNAYGNRITDVGGNLLEIMERERIPWLPLRRMNQINPHPVLFGVYGISETPFVYHHGAGFRDPITRFDLNAAGLYLTAARQEDIEALIDRFDKQELERLSKLELEWRQRILRDPNSWRELLARS